jgi:prepilin-type N-terminal cleavage/methylation domain-containing protein
MSQYSTNSRSFLRRGFTLIEMITVLTIIILVLAIAIPVWNALMGGTNLASAQNQISAFLANARADAIYNRRTTGVCFFIDPKTQRTAMAEVQVQTLYQVPYGGGPATYTSLYQPNLPGTPPPDNGPTNSLEMVNNPDPNNPGSFTFSRDVILLPAGAGVALNNNTYTYNLYNQWGYNPDKIPWLDRYVRLGVIMFGPDGTLATIPFAIPGLEYFTQNQSIANTPSENLLCQRVGMAYSPTVPKSDYDIASNLQYTPPVGSSVPKNLPLVSSVGLVIFDHDAYLAQHASLQVQSGGSTITLGNPTPDPFNDNDMDYYLYTPASYPNPVITWTAYTIQDKFIEENWIDKNGTALMVSPFNGSLIKAK